MSPLADTRTTRRTPAGPSLPPAAEREQVLNAPITKFTWLTSECDGIDLKLETEEGFGKKVKLPAPNGTQTRKLHVGHGLSVDLKWGTYEADGIKVNSLTATFGENSVTAVQNPEFKERWFYRALESNGRPDENFAKNWSSAAGRVKTKEEKE